MFDESARSSLVKLASPTFITGFEHFDLLEVLFDSGQLAENRMFFGAGAL